MSRSKARRAARKRQQQGATGAQGAEAARQASQRPEIMAHEPAAAQQQAVRLPQQPTDVTRNATVSEARIPDTERPKEQHMTERKAVTLACGGFEISDETYATIAEDLMEQAAQRGFWKLTTTKLRSIYALIMNIYAKANTPEEFVAAKPDIQYLKVRMAYEAGREPSVKSFLTNTHLMKLVGVIVGFDQFKLYCRYAEALVAYFRFYGGKDS